MGEVHPRSPAGEGVHRSVVSGARDRRRVARLALGSAILFLVPILYAVTHGGPTQYESQSNYALLASATGDSGSQDVRLPAVADEAGSTRSGAPPTQGKQVVPEKSGAKALHAPDQAPAHTKHDQYYCGFYAQAVTGNVTPEQAARREQTKGAIMGAMGGAVLGALFGGSGGHSSRSAAVGASAGLLAGAAMGSSSARRAADDIRSRYDAAYSSCMNQKDDTSSGSGESQH